MRRRGATAAAVWLVLPGAAQSSTVMACAHDVSPAAFAFRGRIDGPQPSFRRGICSHRQIRALQAAPVHSKRRHRLQLSLAAASRSSPAAADVDGRAGATPVADMPLPQLLQLLDEWNVRYSPSATRDQLEALVTQHMYEQQTTSRSTSAASTAKAEAPGPTATPTTPSAPYSTGKRGKYVKVVDAVVLDEHQRTQGQSSATGEYSGEERRRSRRRRSSPRPEQRQYEPNNRRQWRDWRRRYGRQSEEEEVARSRKQYYQQQYRNGRRRPRRRASDRGREYDLYADYSSDDFNIPESHRRDGQIYDNGMQIFLMGFVEAGKTATQVALGSVADAVNPFSGREGEGGEWWYDEENGREVLDVDVLDFSPPPRERRRRRRRGESSQGRRRSSSGRYGERTRREGYDDGAAYYQTGVPPMRQARSSGAPAVPNERFSTRQVPSSDYTGEGDEESPSGALPRDNTRPQRQVGETEGEPRPVYGLYRGEPTMEQEAQDRGREDHAEQYHERRKQWKDRLRHKFDAALGLQTPELLASQSSETYYDSWKSQMKDVGDERKEVLRQQMNAMDESLAADSEQAKPYQSDKSSASLSPRNRRARMRARSHSGKQSQTPAQRGQSSSSRLDEVPFWREGGTIASLLFDNRPAASSPGEGVGRRPVRRKSLEQYLLSPFGQHHTVTSLFLYISRSALTAFGILCRWAGVRGTVPQPIVATTVFAALISARRGQRVISVALTVLALRLVGEVIHGSLYGNEFWEDERDPETHGWKQKAR